MSRELSATPEDAMARLQITPVRERLRLAGTAGGPSPRILTWPESPSTHRIICLIADGANYRVRLVTASNGIITTIGGNGLITYNPKNMSRNGDVLYFSDSNANRVSKFDLSAGTSSISLVSGTGAASFSASDDIALTARLNTPKGLTIDSAGNIYPADSKNHRVRKITPPTCLWM